MPDYVKPVSFIVLVVFIAGMTGGFIAADRGRRVWAWCLLCAMLPPLLLIIYFAKPLREVEGMFRRCSKCGKLIKWRSKVCRYCRSEQAELPTF